MGPRGPIRTIIRIWRPTRWQALSERCRNPVGGHVVPADNIISDCVMGHHTAQGAYRDTRPSVPGKASRGRAGQGMPSRCIWPFSHVGATCSSASIRRSDQPCPDRKSTRLNSSHVEISYAVFCLKKKKKTKTNLKSMQKKSQK